MIIVKILDNNGKFVDFGFLLEPTIIYGKFGRFSTNSVITFNGSKLKGTQCIIHPMPKLLPEN